MFSVTDELSARTGKVVQFRLKQRFPMIPDALGKIGAFFSTIVPENLAQTEPTKGIKPSASGRSQAVWLSAEHWPTKLDASSETPRMGDKPGVITG